MNLAAVEDFPLRAGLTQFNHASYGLSSLRVIAEGERLRRQIESDPNLHLGAELTQRLTAQSASVAEVLGLDSARMTLCANATSAAAAIIASVPLGASSTVVVLDVEYSSIRRAWEVACAKAGARLITVSVPIPLESTTALLARLDRQVPGPVDYLQVSAITSSTAIQMPIPALSVWVEQRGGHLILDAAHVPGHLPLPPGLWGAAAVFGTLHKWFPTLRPVGLLWRTPEFDIRPAEVSLTWDSPDLVERFSWPGTFDPVPRLCMDAAIGQWREWQADGRLDDCEALADMADRAMVDFGARRTAATEFRPPRLRSFILDGVTPLQVKDALHGAEIRAWVGQGASGECLLRLSTHIYNDENDLDRVTHRIQEVLSR
ncbi:aminotransferase class V-fold PLP-dependent enzyme [Nocardia sp. NPDC058480]|uniref:aminotransferase class V-fold PLP-dependent enzyme n=1 Tax=Nocardia sp. NPDC058480 TaxID=3346522 RepID=UPI0036525F36